MQLIIGIVFGAIFALVSLGLAFLLKRQSPKRKAFPTCYQCGRPMVQMFYLGDDMPYEIKHYLYKYNLPRQVVRRFMCPDSHRELWIAPPVAGEQRGVFISHKL